MEVLIGLIIALVPLLMFPCMTGWCALSLNRKFWPWFIAGFFLPFIGIVILLCLPVKEKKVVQLVLTPVSEEEIFDHLLEETAPKRLNGQGVHYSARA
jgi:hypothetical protein